MTMQFVIIEAVLSLGIVSLPSGGESYSGSLTLNGYSFGSMTAFAFFTVPPIDVSPVKGSGPTWVNPDNVLRYSQTKYDGQGGYALLQPQIFFFTVI